MGLRDFFKRRKKNTDNEAYLDPELDLEKEFARRRHAKDDDFDRIESMQYVRTQCDQVVESSRYITRLKEEYQTVGSYLADVQKIDVAEQTVRESLRGLAAQALKLDAKSERYKKKQANLPKSRYETFERYKDEFPEALTEFQNDEKYMQTVKHDLRMLEGEKKSIREDIRDSRNRRVLVRNLSLVMLFMILALCVIFVAAGLLKSKNGQTAFMVMLLICALIVAGLLILMRRSAYTEQLGEKKLARAVTLLNKTKIKFVNIANSVEYRKTKYSVKNGYQLSHEYELYLMDVKAMENFRTSQREMSETIAAINQILRSLELYDVGVWESQLEALADDREMVEIRHSLNTRRQKLREQIDYNMGRIEEAKKGVVGYMKKHPGEAQAIMEIVDSYDMEIE